MSLTLLATPDPLYTRLFRRPGPERFLAVSVPAHSTTRPLARNLTCLKQGNYPFSLVILSEIPHNFVFSTQSCGVGKSTCEKVSGLRSRTASLPPSWPALQIITQRRWRFSWEPRYSRLALSRLFPICFPHCPSSSLCASSIGSAAGSNCWCV